MIQRLKDNDEVELMHSEDIRFEMLELWHNMDYETLTEEESELAENQLRIYRDVLRRRNYEYRIY